MGVGTGSHYWDSGLSRGSIRFVFVITAMTRCPFHRCVGTTPFLYVYVGGLASSAFVDISGSPYKIVDISVFIAVLGQSPAIGRHVQGLTNRVLRVPANGGTYISDGGTYCFDF